MFDTNSTSTPVRRPYDTHQIHPTGVYIEKPFFPAPTREQTNEKGEKMYIQTRMAQYAEELWELLKKDNTFVYMCGLKGMEKVSIGLSTRGN
ncbi:hypothetical protein AAZV13_01G128700 [Glycine max]